MTKQHDRMSTSSQSSRAMARDPQERHVEIKPPPVIVADGKTHVMPDHGTVILTYHEGKLQYIERHMKEKVT